MRFIELFAGIGGFRYGLEKANDTKGQRLQQGIRQGKGNSASTKHVKMGTEQFHCTWANEIDKYAGQVYRKNFGKGELHEGSIIEIESRLIPEHDLIVAGFPCQSFSIAGKRRGFEDSRGTLFYEICRIAKFHRTPYLLLENVKGLLNHDEGRTFSVILQSLYELGYDCQWQVLNSKDFGVPQNRERVFIVGHLRGQPRPQVFPIGESNQISGQKLKVIRNSHYDTDRLYGIDGIARTIRANAGGKGAKTGLYQIKKIGTYGSGDKSNIRRQIYDKDGISPTLCSGMGEGGGLIPHVTELSKYQEDVVHHKDDTMSCLSSQGGNKLKGLGFQDESNRIRRLTPVECERLQGFPDNWTDGISDTQRYKCLGNAVTTNVITEIGKRLAQEITNV